MGFNGLSLQILSTLRRLSVFAVLIFSLLIITLSSCATLPYGLEKSSLSTHPSSIYEYQTLHDPDGIGKFYLGREIAQVMGYRGAAWLERASREREEQPEKVIEALHLQPTDSVADIGAGTGYFSFRISPLVSAGKVLAVDVQPEMLDLLTFLKQDNHADNVEPILGSEVDPNLPRESVDLALLVDVYHELAYPKEMMDKIVEALKPNGRVVLVEYRGENPLISIRKLHKMTQRQARKEMQAAGLVWESTQEVLPQQHLMVFRKANA
jgi:SAM-dependent methyltransferase